MNKCKKCGAKTYAQVIARDEDGLMRPSGVYRCAGCKVLFTSIQEWRADQSEAGVFEKESMVPTSVTVALG